MITTAGFRRGSKTVSVGNRSIKQAQVASRLYRADGHRRDAKIRQGISLTGPLTSRALGDVLHDEEQEKNSKN